MELAKKDTNSNLQKLVQNLQGTSSSTPEFVDTIAKIESAILKINTKNQSAMNFTKASSECFRLAKKLSEIIIEISSKNKLMDSYCVSAPELGEAYCLFLQSACVAGVAIMNENAETVIIKSSIEIGHNCCRLIDTMKLASSKSSTEQSIRSKLYAISRDISGGMVSLFTNLKNGNKNTAKIEDILLSIGNVIADTDSLIIFAQAGQLDSVNEKDSFVTHQSTLISAIQVFKCTIQVFEKVQISSDIASQLASNSYAALVTFSEILNQGATSLSSSDKDMQVQLLSSSKLLAETLHFIINDTIDDEANKKLPKLLAEMFAVIEELNRIVGILGDESMKGTRALDSVARDILTMVKELESDSLTEGTFLPDEVLGLSKQLMIVCGSIASLSVDKQGEMSNTANTVKKLIDVLLKAGKSSTQNAPEDKNVAMMKALKKSATAIRTLVNNKKESMSDSGSPYKSNKQEFQKEIKEVNACLVDVGSIANKLIPAGYVNANDPNVVAERALGSEIRLIEISVKKLAALKTIEKSNEADEDFELPVQYELLNASKSVTAGILALVKSASGLQRELCAKGVLNDDDGSWNTG